MSTFAPYTAGPVVVLGSGLYVRRPCPYCEAYYLTPAAAPEAMCSFCCDDPLRRGEPGLRHNESAAQEAERRRKAELRARLDANYRAAIQKQRDTVRKWRQKNPGKFAGYMRASRAKKRAAQAAP